MNHLATIALAALSAVGCAGLPGSYSVDPACGAAVAAATESVVEAYCGATDWTCLAKRPYPDSDWALNCTDHYARYGRDPGSASFTTHRVALDRNGLERTVTYLDMHSPAVTASGTALWRVLAHEVAHVFLGAGHTDGAPRSAIFGAHMTDGPARLDASVLAPLGAE